METSGLLERAALARTPEWRNVDLKMLHEEIIPRDRPAVMKGLVRALADGPRQRPIAPGAPRLYP